MLPPLFGLLQVPLKGQQAGGPENNVLVQALQIVLLQLEFRSQVLQQGPFFPHFGQAVPVAGGHMAAVPQQQLHQGGIAHADADDGDPFIFNGIDILF